MIVTLYRTEAQNPVAVEDNTARVAALEAKAVFYEQFDQLAQARAIRKEIEIAEGFDPGLFYPRIPPDEWTIWQWYLPQRFYAYQQAQGRLLVVTPDDLPCVWADCLHLHRFSDPIPDEVLEEVALCVTLRLFHAYAIHAPRRAADEDPLLVGHWYGEHFLLARWGEALDDFVAIRHRYARAHTWWRRWVRTVLMLQDSGPVRG